MAFLKNTTISESLTINSGLFILSGSSLTNISVEDSLNSTSVSYIPYNSSCSELTLFKSSTDIEIGAESDNINNTKVQIYNNGSLNVVSPLYNNSKISFQGWLENTTYTQQIGTQTITYTLPSYTTRASFELIETNSSSNQMFIKTTDFSNPSNLSNSLRIKSDGNIYFLNELSMNNNDNCYVTKNVLLTPGPNGISNFSSNNLLIITTDPECYKDKNLKIFYGSSGVVLESRIDVVNTVKSFKEKIYSGIGTSQYDRFETTISLTDYRPAAEIILYKPVSYLGEHYWRITGTGSLFSGDFHLYHSLGANVNVGTPSWWNTGANNLQINFTGQHRNSTIDNIEEYRQRVGMIVVSCGHYKDLDNNNSIEINQSLPVVGLSTARKQKNVFGVISDKEDDNLDTRVMNFNAWRSLLPKKAGAEYAKVIINSIGEGGIWVTNINGNLQNGDLITTCEIPGYGMKQDENKIANYTVAKITCDCDFDLQSPIYICEEIQWQNQTYKRAFVGCTYHCG